MFDEKIRVPLFMIGSKINQCISISKQVRLIDVFPTICEIVGIPKWEEKVDGISLYPLLENKKMDDLIAYIESTPAVVIETNNVIGIRTDKYKYFRNSKELKKNVHLYDLENDPYENNNISKNNPAIIEKMENLINNMKGNGVRLGNMITEEEEKKISEELKKLGYM